MFDRDIPKVKGTPSNSLAISKAMVFRGLIALSEEPPYETGSPIPSKWDNNLRSLLTRRHNDPPKSVE